MPRAGCPRRGHCLFHVCAARREVPAAWGEMRWLAKRRRRLQALCWRHPGRRPEGFAAAAATAMQDLLDGRNHWGWLSRTHIAAFLLQVIANTGAVNVIAGVGSSFRGCRLGLPRLPSLTPGNSIARLSIDDHWGPWATARPVQDPGMDRLSRLVEGGADLGASVANDRVSPALGGHWACVQCVGLRAMAFFRRTGWAHHHAWGCARNRTPATRA
mmetsp:Transcript_125970/g.268772  ORF Transcript_125970/g.268772 Transcript_125970/m.268772 type:complete len:215 (-) Transcript_125970:1116-1760(-)